MLRFWEFAIENNLFGASEKFAGSEQLGGRILRFAHVETSHYEANELCCVLCPFVFGVCGPVHLGSGHLHGSLL